MKDLLLRLVGTLAFCPPGSVATPGEDLQGLYPRDTRREPIEPVGGEASGWRLAVRQHQCGEFPDPEGLVVVVREADYPVSAVALPRLQWSVFLDRRTADMLPFSSRIGLPFEKNADGLIYHSEKSSSLRQPGMSKQHAHARRTCMTFVGP
ncbi:MAG: hypothetical protein OKBPIBMD_00844 [Chlorobi bacterium]|nr:hypothetical protein [Chlorobiota bacterium]